MPLRSACSNCRGLSYIDADPAARIKKPTKEVTRERVLSDDELRAFWAGCERLGWPHRDQADIARAWKHILGKVSSYADLEPALLGRVEELIDFVTSQEAS